MLPVFDSIDSFDAQSDFLKFIPWTSILDLNDSTPWLMKNRQHFKLECAMQYSNAQLADYGTKKTLCTTNIRDFSHLASLRLNDSMLIVIAGFGDPCMKPESWNQVKMSIDLALIGIPPTRSTPVIRLLAEKVVPLSIGASSTEKDLLTQKLCAVSFVRGYVR